LQQDVKVAIKPATNKAIIIENEILPEFIAVLNHSFIYFFFSQHDGLFAIVSVALFPAQQAGTAALFILPFSPAQQFAELSFVHVPSFLHASGQNILYEINSPASSITTTKTIVVIVFFFELFGVQHELSFELQPQPDSFVFSSIIINFYNI